MESEEIETRLHFMELPPNMVGYTIDGENLEDTLKELCIVYNANRSQQQVEIPEGTWNVYVNEKNAGTKPLAEKSGKTITIEPLSAIVLGR